VYVLGAMGLVGFAAFGVLASVGKGDETSLRDSCAPDCSRSSVDLAAPRLPRRPVDVVAGAGGARVTWTRSF
jgi:hypothetical protein